MKLSYLIKTCTPVWKRLIDPASCSEIKDARALQSVDPEITSIHANAGEVKSGGLFIAIQGFKADGHDYIEQAIANGAVAIVVKDEKNVECRFSSDHNQVVHTPVVVEVTDTRKAMSAIAARFYKNPSDSMTLIAITGTNGKTTTSFLIESILNCGGYKTGVIGTVNYRYGNQSFENPVTTPESIDLQRILSQMKDAGVSHVVMEVSSHAIDMHRIRDCEFDVGVFTNLTQDHLDYHKTMAAYFGCKKKFFTKHLKRGKKAEKSIAVINIDDPYGQIIAMELGGKALTTGVNPTTDNNKNPNIFSSNITDDVVGIKGNLHFNTDLTDIKIRFKSKLAGQFNLENILSAAGAAHALNISPEIIGRGIESCSGVPGRLERVENSGGRYVFVDYAHTPDALESILRTLKMRAPARLISIFGCGGDRDRTKRPIMGAIAKKYSDIAIVTSDNPRSENPEAIINEIIEGMKDQKPCNNCDSKIIIEPDRAKALAIAVNISQSGDIIVAAGKGHETYQITANGKIDFDDRIILKQALIQCGFSMEEEHNG